jgi:tetratricopeptide (TPR) repeat protein
MTVRQWAMKSPSIDALLATAVDQFNAGRHESALRACREALHLQASHPAANHLMANLLLGQGDAAGAWLHAQSSLAARPGQARVMCLAAKAAAALGDAAQANALAREAAQAAADDPHIRRTCAALLVDGGEARQAAALLESMPASAASDAANLYELGRARHALGELVAARSAWQAALQLDPELVPGWFALSLVLQDLGDAPAAATALQRLLDLAPRHAPAWINLGLLRQEQGQMAAALAAYARAHSLQPELIGRIAHALASQPHGALWTRTADLEDALRGALIPMHAA